MVSNILGKFRFPLFLFIFLLQFLTFTQVFAQQFYPVQVRSYVQNPSVYLEDYYNPNNFRVQVTLTDRFVPNLDVVLNLTVKGPNSVLFSTKTGIDLTLNGGFTYTLSRSELEKLLTASNLTKIPTSIPEDTYTFVFSVTDRLSGATVSNSLTDFATVLVTLFDPPMLTSPANGEMLDFGISGQNFMLSWIPRSFSLNPQEQVKYRLIMVQVPENRNAYDAIRMAEFKTNNTIENISFNSFTYDESLIALVSGYTYAWQIQAYEERAGQQVFSRFRNEGKSDVFTFKVKEQCPPIFLQKFQLTVNPLSNKQEVLLSWNKEPKHEFYEIKYRPFGSSQWTVVQQTENSLSLGDRVLIKNKDYEYSVSARCVGWQDAVYGGLFKLPGGDCEAPTPVLVESNTAQGISLKWDAVPAANTYSLYYTDANGKKNELIGLSNPTAQLPAIDAGAYTIRVDAVCSNATATGSDMELAYNEQSLAGNCPIPVPFNFLAQRNPGSTDPLEAKLSWPKLPIHEAYKITWYQDGSTATPNLEIVSTPEVLVTSINSNEFYRYTIEYTCKGGKKSTSPVGGFRIENTDGGLTLSPTTADCFPPAVMNAEARSSTSARIDWTKVSGAQEYLVVYYPKDSPDQEQLFTTSAANARLTNLVEGATYTYKIRCRCSGNYSIDSEPREFDLTKFYTNNQCDSVAGLTVNQVAETEIQLSWPYPQEVKTNMDEHSAYTIRYKENGQVWADAYTIDFQLTSDLKTLFDDTKTVRKTIDQLSSGTKYDIEVKARCGTQIAKANEPISATTKEEEAADCSSGGVCDRTSKKPISTISVGDTIGMADCNIVVATIETDDQGANLWKGTGTTQIPLLGQSELIRANVYFDSLLVNETACVLDGNVDLNLENTLLSDEQKATIKGTIDKAKQLSKDAQNISDQIADGAETASEYGNQGLDYFQGGGNVGRVKTGGLAEEAVTAVGLNTIQVNGDQITVDGKDYPVADFPKLFKDENGNVYAVAANGTKTEVGKYDTSLAGYQDSIPVAGPVLTFKANSSARYAFDAWQTEYGRSVVMQPHYLSLSDKFYSAKAIIPATTDKVDFSLSDGKEKNLIFVNRDGFVFKTLDKNTLQVVGGSADDAQEIFALYDDNGTKKLIGALLLASYAPKQKTVYIVPVKMGNSFDLNLSQVQEQLNKAYGSIGINYTVKLDKTFDTNSDWCEGSNCDFSTGGSGLLNNDYTGVEARVRDAYIDFKGADSLDPDAAYLFAIGVTKADKGDEALEGKMNFGKQVGFLYAAGSQNSKTLGRTLAHELGHGNYKLHHIFSDMYLGKDITYTSNNLMSYKPGVDALDLNKLQWDVVHNPGVTWGIFKRDKDQEVITLGNVKSFLERIREKRIEGGYIKLLSEKINKNSEWTGDKIVLADTDYGTIKILFKHFDSDFSFNPALYSLDTYTETEFWLFDKKWYAINYKDESGNDVINILVENYVKRASLCEYLYGKCDFMEKLEQIHQASLKGKDVTLSYSTNCSYISQLKNIEIEDVTYEQLFVSFTKSVQRNTDVTFSPASYKQTHNGFQLYKEDDIVFEIKYFGNGVDKDKYTDNLEHLREWLFGKDNVLIMKMYPNGSITQYVPLKIKDDFDKQFNDETYKGKSFRVNYLYYESEKNIIDLGTYNYYLTENTYVETHPLYGTTLLIDLIDVRQMKKNGFDVVWNSASNRYYLNLKTFGSLLCAFRLTGYNDFVFNGFSDSKGVSIGGSQSHKNGFNGDLRYLRTDQTGNSLVISGDGWKDMDETRQNNFNDFLYKFRWLSLLSQKYNKDKLLNHTNHDSGGGHYDHLHIQGYNQSLFKIEYEKE